MDKKIIKSEVAKFLHRILLNTNGGVETSVKFEDIGIYRMAVVMFRAHGANIERHFNISMTNCDELIQSLGPFSAILLKDVVEYDSTTLKNMEDLLSIFEQEKFNEPVVVELYNRGYRLACGPGYWGLDPGEVIKQAA